MRNVMFAYINVSEDTHYRNGEEGRVVYSGRVVDSESGRPLDVGENPLRAESLTEFINKTKELQGRGDFYLFRVRGIDGEEVRVISPGIETVFSRAPKKKKMRKLARKLSIPTITQS